MEIKETEESKSIEVSSDNDGDTSMGNNNNKRHERASLSLLNSEGILKDPIVTLPAGIGLDSPPGTCRKRSFSSSNVGEKEFQRNQSPTSTKMKRLSLSDKEVMRKIKKISSGALDVTHVARSVTQVTAAESLVLNEKHTVNVLPEKISFLPVKDEMEKSGSNSFSFQDVSHNAQSVMQDEPMRSMAPNEKNEVKNCVTLESNVTGNELSNLRAKYGMDKIGTNELNKQDNAVELEKTNATKKCDLLIKGNESNNSVTYDVSDFGSGEATQETALVQNEGDKERNSLGHNKTNYVSRPSSTIITQVINEENIENNEPPKPPLVKGLKDEVGGVVHSKILQDDERGKH